jgi:hypothetical protein
MEVDSPVTITVLVENASCPAKAPDAFFTQIIA